MNSGSILESSLRIGSAIFLIVGASLIIPKIADAASTLNSVVPNYTIPGSRTRVNEFKENFPDSRTYQPPNFGRPATAYGSGTR
ncbi:hypothetical protein [Rivularia sp. PCC 7116]|uniref:hypothetical protein n=1 Tax=Rivularia sp. PCC 7116 TaxID=373994 RepID=UPI0002F0CB76|nr:hypothetical protein [Rivularia sp. PCC 7116]